MAIRPQRGLLIGRLAPVALMPGAALAVHQLRYWLAFGGRAGAQLQAQGHSYLHSVVPWVILLIALSAGAFLKAMGRAVGGHCSLPRYTLSFVGLWLVCAITLVVIYATQESLEGLFAAGHAGGLVGIFGDGGWWSVPAAVAVALVLAAAFHGAHWTLHEVARRHRRVALRSPRTSGQPRHRDVVLPRLTPLADGWSGRGPPR